MRRNVFIWAYTHASYINDPIMTENVLGSRRLLLTTIREYTISSDLLYLCSLRFRPRPPVVAGIPTAIMARRGNEAILLSLLLLLLYYGVCCRCVYTRNSPDYVLYCRRQTMRARPRVDVSINSTRNAAYHYCCPRVGTFFFFFSKIYRQKSNCTTKTTVTFNILFCCIGHQ